MEAKKIENQAAQGDVLVRRCESIPASATKVAPKGGRHVVAHSETGHHHWLAAAGIEMFEDPRNPMICFLRIDASAAGVVTHDRSYDTHAPVALGEGTWEVRRQREMTPEGWQRVAD